MRIAVAGSSGFVGSAVVAQLERRGCEVVRLEGSRLRTRARSLPDLRNAAESIAAIAHDDKLEGVQALINAAGLARPKSAFDDALVGANVLLPAVHALSAHKAGVRRVVHISSAAVYGSAPEINEASRPVPSSPYGKSKLLGELLLRDVAPQSVIYRPTSVHGFDRRITQVATRFARSPLSSVAGEGKAPTPQVLVENVGAAAVFLALNDSPPANPVIHPWEGVTTASFLRSLSEGREPFHLPPKVARAIVAAAVFVGQAHPTLGANARRLEMLWFGQKQGDSWLLHNGYRSPCGWPHLDPHKLP